MSCYSKVLIALLLVLAIMVAILIHTGFFVALKEEVTINRNISLVLSEDEEVLLDDFVIPDTYNHYNVIVIKTKTWDIYTEDLNKLCGDNWTYVDRCERYSNGTYHYLARKDVKE